VSADLGREAVYAAEIAAFEGTSYEALVPLDELVATAARVTTGVWWPHGPISVVAARSDASSSSTRQHGDRTPIIRLAAPQMTPATLLHELAHVLAGVGEGHGPVFRRAHVDLVARAFGAGPAAWLTDAYAVHRLAVGERRWPPPAPAPPIGAGEVDGPIAL
jgi:hypothetical protein